MLSDAEDHVFGMCLLNDWSARDIQSWEYQPLGPFLGKSFLTTISPWIITLEALRPFRITSLKRSSKDPALLPYLIDLHDQKFGGLDIQLEVSIQSQNMKEINIAPQSITKSSFADQYWSIFQMVAHHTVNGCNLNTGDLIGSGTVSGPNEGEAGCFLEMTQGGSKPITLKDGSERRFLEDGDEIMFAAKCKHTMHTTIGFGECRGIVNPRN
jgi:fumarylacetoacetase